jgi:hypothetical protein
LPVPAGFPPTPWYRLDVDNEAVTLATMRVVAFHREDLTCGDLGLLDYAGGPRDERAARRAWLQVSGGPMTRAACEHAYVHDVVWNGAAPLRGLVAKDQDAIAHDFAAMVRELLQRGTLLRDDAKTARPDVRVVLHDQRGDTNRPLPKPEDRLAAPKPAPRVALR